MAERRGPARWISGLLGRRAGPPAPRDAGRPTLIRGEAALLEVERLGSGALLREGPRRPARAVVAEAAGLALTGVRASAFVPGDALADVHDPLEAAASRCTPLLVHATLPEMPCHGGGPGRGGPHALADTGAFVVVARDAQQWIDLALVGRRLSEEALVPGVVACDRREIAASVRELVLPEARLVEHFLGRAGDEVPSATPAQVLLFGDERRRVPRWFDPDRPVAHGILPRGADLTAAVAARHRFFADHVAPLASRSMAALAALTGRPLAPFTAHRLDDARHVVVTHGASAELAEAVADDLWEADRVRVGVVGLSWLRPFPADALAEALRGAETVTVLERAVDALADLPPLARELRACGAVGEALLLSAQHGLGGQALTAAEVAAVVGNATRATDRRTRYWLGVSAPTADDRFPKRQALLQRLHRDHPGLGERLLDAGGELRDVRPPAARTVTLAAFRPDDDELPERLAAALSDAAGPAVLVRALPAEPECLRLVGTAAPEPFRDPGDGVPAELALVVGPDAPAALDPVADLVAGGTLAVATSRPAAELRDALPEPWRDAIAARALRVVRIEGGVTELFAALPTLLDGGGGLEEISVSACAADPAGAEAPLPLAVRRFRRVGETHDNVARFWGEVAQPRLEGPRATPVPDPYLGAGTMPSGTATFHDMTAERATVPLVKAADCTGCGACWTICPDSSIAPTTVGVRALLDVAFERVGAKAAGPPDPARARLKRVLPRLAKRTESVLAKAGATELRPQHVREALAWLAEKQELPPDERDELATTLDPVLDALCRTPLAATQVFFHGPRAAGREPELLALAVNPQSCQGCGGCAEACTADAITIVPQRPDHVQRLATAWQDWERLPDSAGATIARAAAEIGELSALLLSRHVFFAVAGGDGAEPGSGERLATRQVAAVLEAKGQRASLARVERLDDLVKGLKAALLECLTGRADVSDLDVVQEALGRGPAEARAGELLTRLQDAGAADPTDAARARDLVDLARDLDELRLLHLQGPTGIGRSRFGLVVAGAELATWAACFPRNPFSVPVVLDLAGSGPDLATGLLRGLVDRHVAEERRLRRARLLIDSPPDAAAREAELESLSWEDLSDAEKAAAPALIVLASPASLLGEAAAGLSGLLVSDLPVKVLLLADSGSLGDGVDPVLLALAHRRAFVLSTSVAHPEHLHSGVSEALAFPGPALVRVHAPSPRRDGFATERTIERARAAVACRLHPLLSYDPRRAGVFGTRLSLEGNPDPEATWARDEAGRDCTPLEWLVDGRDEEPPPRATRLVTERAEAWATLQEMAGLVTPFTEDVRRRLESEIAHAREAELDDLRRAHESELGSLEGAARERHVATLTERLMRLAGHPGGAGGAR